VLNTSGICGVDAQQGDDEHDRGGDAVDSLQGRYTTQSKG
jgi:hypothetical protein